MKLTALLTASVCVCVLAGCGKPPATDPNSAAPQEPLAPPAIVPEPIVPAKAAKECVVYITVGAEGKPTRVVTSLEETDAKQDAWTLKTLRKKIESAAQEKGKGGANAKASDAPEAKVAVLVVKVKASAKGTIEAMSLEKDGKSTDLGASVENYAKALKAEAPKDPKDVPTLLLLIDGGLIQEYVVQLVDQAVRVGFTDVSPILERGEDAPKLADLGDDPGGPPIAEAPTVILRVHKDAPSADVHRLLKALRGWGVTRIQLRVVP
jgi:biopolymer transport protein ExbD